MGGSRARGPGTRRAEGEGGMKAILAACVLVIAACGGNGENASSGWSLTVQADYLACTGHVDASGIGAVSCGIFLENGAHAQGERANTTVVFGNETVIVNMDGVGSVQFTPETRTPVLIDGQGPSVIGGVHSTMRVTLDAD